MEADFALAIFVVEVAEAVDLQLWVVLTWAAFAIAAEGAEEAGVAASGPSSVPS